MTKITLGILLFLVLSNSYAMHVERFYNPSCEVSPLFYKGFNAEAVKIRTLRFDGRINSQPIRNKIVQNRFLAVLHTYMEKLCNGAEKYDTQNLAALLWEKEDILMTHVGTIHFPTGVYLPDRDAISHCCSRLRHTEYDGLLIIGSADSVGKESDNKELSYLRSYHIAKGLPQTNPIYLMAVGDLLQHKKSHTEDPYYRRADIYFFKHL